MSFRFHLGAGLLGCTWAFSSALHAGESAATAPQPLWKAVTLPEAAAGLTLRGICFVDAKQGWIVGDKGLCLATADGGETWAVVPTGSDATLRAVRFLDARRGFACGDGDSAAPKSTGHVVMGRPYQAGLLLSTADGGKTWKKNWVPCNFEIWCVEASTAPVVQVGVGTDAHLDGDITRSSDGGATWEERRVFRALCDIRAIDAKRWVAVGSPVSIGFTGGIQDPAYLAKDCRALFSDDAGQTWKVAKGSDGPAVLRGLLVRKGLPVLAVGDGGALLASEDRGESWTAVAHPAGTDLHLRAVAASADNKALVAVGARGRFLLSVDGGKTWRASWTGTNEHLLAVATCGERFWSVGTNGFAASCEAKTLLAARELVAAPPPPAEPARQATAEQRARVRVGDYLIVAQRMKCPEMGMDFEVQVRLTVAALEADGFTLVQEIVKGTPPPGTPPKTESRVPLAELEEFSGYEVGRSREIPAGSAKVSRVREPNQTLTVAGKELECLVLKTEGEIPGVGRIASRRRLRTAGSKACWPPPGKCGANLARKKRAAAAMMAERIGFRMMIAAGTALSGRPPHRSVCAELPHTAPTLDDDWQTEHPDTDAGFSASGASDWRSSRTCSSSCGDRAGCAVAAHGATWLGPRLGIIAIVQSFRGQHGTGPNPDTRFAITGRPERGRGVFSVTVPS